MATHEAHAHAQAHATAQATADKRLSMWAYFLRSAHICAKRARSLENAGDSAGRDEHLAMVTSCVFQCVSAITAEESDLATFGAERLIDESEIKTLAAGAATRTRKPIVERFNLMLSQLSRPPLTSTGARSAVELLARFRNHLIHYDSVWESTLVAKDLPKQLAALGLRHSHWDVTSSYPLNILSADFAAWAVSNTVNYLDEIHGALGTPLKMLQQVNRIDAFAARVRQPV
jgi:hypothetical protein